MFHERKKQQTKKMIHKINISSSLFINQHTDLLIVVITLISLEHYLEAGFCCLF